MCPVGWGSSDAAWSQIHSLAKLSHVAKSHAIGKCEIRVVFCIEGGGNGIGFVVRVSFWRYLSKTTLAQLAYSPYNRNMKNIPDFDQLDDLLKRAGSDVSASESHGMLCGLLCSSGTQAIDQLWLTQLIDEGFSEENSTIKELLAAAQALHQDAVRQINHETLEFSLLMPDVEESLELRTNNLANWCLGFNYGLGIGGYKENSSSKDVV